MFGFSLNEYLPYRFTNFPGYHRDKSLKLRVIGVTPNKFLYKNFLFQKHTLYCIAAL